MNGRATYTMQVEGDITRTHVAVVPSSARPALATFAQVRFTYRVWVPRMTRLYSKLSTVGTLLQGDACHLPTGIGHFTVVHAANLLCRLPDPM